MRRLAINRYKLFIHQHRYVSSSTRPLIIQIHHGTFYRHHPNSTHISAHNNPPLFQNLNFELRSFSEQPEYWAIIGPSSSGKTTFLQVLQERHICIPPGSRTYPYLTSLSQPRTPSQAIKYVGFDSEATLGKAAPQSAYLSARYESRRESTDFSLLNYLLDKTELNPLQPISSHTISPSTLSKVVKDLNLEELIDMPVSNLSFGQMRRARIARALLGRPEMVLLDEPFMGLDPMTVERLGSLLGGLAERREPRLVVGLRSQDLIPEWVTHLIVLRGCCEVVFKGRKGEFLRGGERGAGVVVPVGSEGASSEIVQEKISSDGPSHTRPAEANETTPDSIDETAFLSRDGYPLQDTSTPEIGETLVEMEGVHVQYSDKSVLGKWKQNVSGTPKDGLWWTVRRGQRWGIFGSNGSGKTTILSLICSDHPQTYSLPIKLFGRSRLPEPGQPGISVFDIQAKIGHSSPEIHNHIPRSLTLRQVLENAWSDTFKGVPRFDPNAHEKIDACLRWFKQDLRLDAPSTVKKLSEKANSTEDIKIEALIKPTWADHLPFGGLPFSAQKVALFIRAIIKQPDIVVLDEAFSGMDTGVRDRCLLFLAHGENKQYLPATSHQSHQIINSDISQAGLVRVGGLMKDQALLCISHIREEIPGSIREWICLPEANTGESARFGRLEGPIEGDYGRWGEIWGM